MSTLASIARVQSAACAYFTVSRAKLTSSKRESKRIAFARHVAMYLCWRRFAASMGFADLGRAFGDRRHSTVQYAVREITKLRARDPIVRAQIEELERRLDGSGGEKAVPELHTMKAIQHAVAQHFSLRVEDLVSEDRQKRVAFARHVAMYLCRRLLRCSYEDLGAAFGKRDHTTALSAVRRIEALRVEDPDVRARLGEIEHACGVVTDAAADVLEELAGETAPPTERAVRS